MSDSQTTSKELLGATPRFPEKYIDQSVQPTDINIADQWAVTTVADPCVGNLATPVNSGYFTKAFINNLPFYREGISPNFRGLETGAAFGYLLYGPFTMTGPLRNSDAALTVGLLAAVGAVHILTALLVLYNAPGKARWLWWCSICMASCRNTTFKQHNATNTKYLDYWLTLQFKERIIFLIF